jgi:MOSC domain-containing protein YiiM
METLGHVGVSRAEGVHGDYRGALATQKRSFRRQVSLIERASWEAALAEAGAELAWHHSRRNLLLDGIRLPRAVGTRVLIGASLVIEILDECDPCARMEALAPGLCAALTPDWRGGFLGRVVEDGDIALGDQVKVI